MTKARLMDSDDDKYKCNNYSEKYIINIIVSDGVLVGKFVVATLTSPLFYGSLKGVDIGLAPFDW